MTDRDRRDFLKRSAAAAALGIAGAGARAEAAVAATNAPATGPGGSRPDGPPTRPAAATGGSTGARSAAQASATMRAIGAAVLPVTALGNDGVARVVDDFQAWIDRFEPVAEMPHGYLSRGLHEINYGPPHPGPRWASQAEALDIEAGKRHGVSFAELDIDRRRMLIEGQLERDEYGRLPNPAQARHVAIGLMAFFYDSSQATDLCYQAKIGAYTCRGLGGLPDEPEPLGSTP